MGRWVEGQKMHADKRRFTWREMRKSGCLVHLPDYREKNGQETQTLHTDTWRHMRAWAVRAVNRQKPKMVENGGAPKAPPCSSPPSLYRTIIGAPLGSRTHKHRDPHTHTPLTLPFPPNEPVIDEVTGWEVISQWQEEKWKDWNKGSTRRDKRIALMSILIVFGHVS